MTLLLLLILLLLSIVLYIHIKNEWNTSANKQKDSENLETLNRQIADLTWRIYRIEEHLKISDIKQAAPEPLQQPEPKQSADTSNKPEVVFLSAADTKHPDSSAEKINFEKEPGLTEKPSSIVKTTPPKSRIEWETIIGGKWSLWIGSLAVFLAAAFFMAYEWQNFGPDLRIGIEILSGIMFIAAGEISLEKGEPKFGEGLIGTGLALLYLTIYAVTAVYPIFTIGEAFALMCGITLIGTAISLWHNSENLSVMASAGGFLTLVLLHPPSLMLPLVYAAILNLGILILSLFKRWSSLKWLSFIATILIFDGMIENQIAVNSLSLSISEKSLFLSFFTLYYFLFFGASCFHSLIHQEETKAEDLLLLIADTSAYALSYSALHFPTGFPAGFPIFLSILYFSAAWLVYHQAEKNLILRNTFIGIAIFFLTVAIPIQLHQGEISIGWSIEAAVLITLGTQFQNAILNREGEIIWVLSLAAAFYTIFTGKPEPHLLFLNRQSLPLSLNFAANLWITAYKYKKRKGTIAPVYMLAACLEGAWLLAQETYLGFSWIKVPSLSTWVPAAIDSISILWAGYASLLTIIGVKFQNIYLRWISPITLLLSAFLTLTPTLYLIVNSATENWIPFFNLRFTAFLFVIAAASFIYNWTKKDLILLTEKKKQILTLTALLIFFLGLWGLTQEVYLSFWFQRNSLGPHWDRTAQLGISLIWMLCGIVLLISGIVKQSQLIRILALGLLGLTILKVFLLDLAFLPTPYRILSFLGLGLALIGISWLYNQFGKSIGTE